MRSRRDAAAIDIAGPLDGDFRWTMRLSADRPDLKLLAAVLGDATEQISSDGGGPAQLWIPEVDQAADDLAVRSGFVAYRDLWQLRAPLPVPGPRTDLPVRGFEPDDLDEFIKVNARAFEWHPEQSRLTAEDVRRRMDEPWFSAAGFLLHHIDSRLAGFCWTRVHRDATPHLGEIYAIAVDPEFHGRGLGGPVTQAGLDHLADEGLGTAMLYVESDNDAANRVYERLGFTRHHIDRAYTTLLGTPVTR